MRYICKLTEPPSLQEYRASPGAEFDGPNFTPVKKDIKSNLLKEQGYLCAYCMGRIDANKMKVEHWECQSLYRNKIKDGQKESKNGPQKKDLNYNNMLGCCDGGESRGSKPKDQTCDTRKGNFSLKYNPANQQHRINDIIKYNLSDGKIFSSDFEFDDQINKVLNLNYIRICKNRLVLIESIRENLDKRVGKRTKTQIDNFLSYFIGKNSEGKLMPYYGIGVFYLENKLQN